MQINDCIRAALARPLMSFIYGGSVSPEADYTRSGTGYSIDSSGDPFAVPTDTPMSDSSSGSKEYLTYAGVNLVEGPNDFAIISLWDSIGGSPALRQSNVEIAPDGSMTGDRIFSPSGLVALKQTISVEENTEYTWSFYAKNNGSTLAEYSVFNSSGSSNIIAPTGYLSEISETEWVRIEVPFTTPAGCTSVFVYPMRTSGATNIDIFFWGGNVVLGSPKPFILSTVNPNTLSILNKDIDTASYLFETGESDKITVPHAAVLDYVDGDIVTISGCTKIPDYTAGDRQRIISKDGQYALRIDETGVLSFAIGNVAAAPLDTTSLVDGTEYCLKAKYDTNAAEVSYYIDEVLSTTVSFDSKPTTVGDELVFGSSGTSDYIDGYVWDIQVKINGILIDQWPLAEYRKDNFVRALNGNHGTASRAVNLLISENDAFGYAVGEKARKPFISNGVPSGIEGLLRGVGDGDDLSEPLTDGDEVGAVSGTTTANTFTTTGNGGISYLDIVEIGKTYELVADGSSTATMFQLYNDYGDVVHLIGSFGENRFIAVTKSLYLRNEGAGATTVNWSLREVSPAFGSIRFNAYVPADLSEDMPLTEFQEGSFEQLKIKATTGLVELTDGTNTAVSATAVTAGTYATGWISYYGDQMHVTLDGTKGTVSDFTGDFGEIGNRLFGLTSETLQRVTDLILYNTPISAGSYDGAYSVYDGEDSVVDYL